MVCVCGGRVHATEGMQRTEDNFVVQVLSSPLYEFQDWNQVTRLVSEVSSHIEPFLWPHGILFVLLLPENFLILEAHLSSFTSQAIK